MHLFSDHTGPIKIKLHEGKEFVYHPCSLLAVPGNNTLDKFKIKLYFFFDFRAKEETKKEE